MTVQETARLLRVSPVTVRRFIASRRLPAVRVGRGVRVRREDVEKLPAAVGAPGMTTRHRKHGGLFTKDDALWRIVGIGSDEASDVSENKYKYLAEAYADLHEEA